MFKEILSKEEMKFNILEKEVFKLVCIFGCMLIKYFLEKYDQKLLKSRDKSIYRNKGKRKNTIKTIMGEVEYKRTMYLANGKYMYLLDEVLKINVEGKVSENLAETAIELATSSKSYREAEETLKNTTNAVLSHEAIRQITIRYGEKIVEREKEEIKYYQKDQLIKGTKEIKALFEEADGLWINLQGKDREKGLKRRKEELKKKGKEIYPKTKIKTELKLHVMYEGWKKGDLRHRLVNKKAIAGIMKPKDIKELREARIYQQYDVDKIKLRVVNGDGAKWTKGITPKGGVYQKDAFHIQQEIVRDVPKKYREEINKVLRNKEYKQIPAVIEKLKYEVGGEEKAVKKLEKLKSYLSSGLERYQEIVTIPEAVEGIEYRNMGTQESQIFSFLKVRFCSGRKSFSLKGANALAKVCVAVKDKEFRIEDLETEIPIDTSIEEYIKEIENKIKESKKKKTKIEGKKGENYCKNIHLENAPKFMRDIAQGIDLIDMKCSF